uniref:Uncharacterized protein n=1 Tax=Aegilops tauschii subsp. strangulata TaxID=200361 RepID=A0A453I333_AEGTS
HPCCRLPEPLCNGVLAHFSLPHPSFTTGRRRGQAGVAVCHPAIHPLRLHQRLLPPTPSSTITSSPPLPSLHPCCRLPEPLQLLSSNLNSSAIPCDPCCCSIPID